LIKSLNLACPKAKSPAGGFVGDDGRGDGFGKGDTVATIGCFFPNPAANTPALGDEVDDVVTFDDGRALLAETLFHGLADIGRSPVPDVDEVTGETGVDLCGDVNGGDGRARDAVDERVGVACDDERIAGTEGDFIIGLVRFPANSTNLAGSEVDELLEAKGCGIA